MAKNKKVYWKPQYGKKIEINSLDNKYLTNILLFLRRKGKGNLHGMRITYKRKPDLEQLKTILTENKYIYCPRHEQVNKMSQEIYDKHHWDRSWYKYNY